MEEKRKSFRIRKPLLVKFRHSSGKQYTICITDINENGVRFLSTALFAGGDSLSLSLKLPNNPNQWQECKGEVLESKDITKYPGAFVSGFQTRIKFTSVPENTAKFLKEYCDFALRQDQALERIVEQQLRTCNKDSDKRSGVRINKFLVAMYSELTELMSGKWDITAIRNISTGGAVFTTKVFYNNSAHLRLMVKVPSKPFDWLDFDTRVVESRQLKNIEDLLIGGTYLTRVQFISVPLEKREQLDEYIEWFISRLTKQKNLGLE